MNVVIDFKQMDEPTESGKLLFAELEKVYKEMGHGDNLTDHSASRSVEYTCALQKFGLFTPANRVLDAGCGASPILPFLSKQGFKDLTGIDSQSSFDQPTFGFRPEWAQQFGINYVQANIITYRSQVFDVIFCISVIEHIFRPIDQLKALVQLWVNLKDGGRLIVTLDYRWELLMGFIVSLGGLARVVDTLNWQDKVYGICVEKTGKEGMAEWVQINK